MRQHVAAEQNATTLENDKGTDILHATYSLLRIAMSRELVPTWWPALPPRSERAWRRRNQLAVGDRVSVISMRNLRSLLYSVFHVELESNEASSSSFVEGFRKYLLEKLGEDVKLASLRKFATLKHQRKYAIMHDKEILSQPNIEFSSGKQNFLFHLALLMTFLRSIPSGSRL